MSVLPIVDRELRVAARRWSTYLTRSGVALLALLIGMPSLMFGLLAGGMAGGGRGVFTTLSFYAFVVCVVAGIWLTADSLSGEKRQGTLGLLFLTDLRGYDVVLGKFVALGLSAMYAFVAVLPALALPLLIGGVTPGEFWRVALALVNLLFLSLCAGMLVSAGSRNASKTFSGTLMLLLALVMGLPLLASLATRIGSPVNLQWLALLSPHTPFSAAQQWGVGARAGDYWLSLGLSHGIAWGFLALASLWLPRAWQEGETRAAGFTWWGRVAGARVARVFRVRRSPLLLEKQPVLWLMGERPVLRILLWVLAGGWGVFVTASMVLSRDMDDLAFGFLIGGWAYLYLFKLAMVEHACRFWVEARQNESLETLLSVPLESGRIISSHWASLRRHFLWPVLLVVAFSTLPGWWLMVEQMLVGGNRTEVFLGGIFASGFFGFLMAWALADFLAIGWTGMWLALKLKRPQFASGFTLVLAVVLPYMFCWPGFGVTLVLVVLPMSLITSNLRGLILQHHSPVYRGESRA